MNTMTLYRAANDETIVGSASFAESREVAELYRDNPGFGGQNLYRAIVEIDPATVLDLVDAPDAIETLMAVANQPNPGAIGADEWAPQLWSELRDAGHEWVRVRESYPEESITWIFVGSDDPELEEIA